jgi:FdrA protein
VIDQVVVRAGAYHDSVTLMQVSGRLSAADGVLVGQVALGTELNLGLLAALSFTLPPAGPNDLVLAIRAVDRPAAERALDLVEVLLAPAVRPARTAGAGPTLQPPRTVAAAAAEAAAAGYPARLALISVPGEHAFTEAMDALDSGLNVMVFSDNVPVHHEIRLKDEGLSRGLLVMGPDCGTAVLSGVGLGFANVLRPGPVALVAASGTGAQQLACLLDAAGVGVRHILGVGGRDLSAEVDGRATRQALALLDQDPAVELIVLVSKPPDPQVAQALRRHAAGLRTPVQFVLLGSGEPDLSVAAQQVVARLGGTWAEPQSWPAPARPDGDLAVLRGAFCGGTLCDEAMLVAAARLGPIGSNIPLPGAPRIDSGQLLAGASGSIAAAGHLLVDFGDDDLTRGRPHPMIDSSLRIRWLLGQAAAAPAVLLLDVLLGHGAHPDPAADLAPAIDRCQAAAAAAGHRVAVVVSLCGTEGDPQGLTGQAARLAAAGACVHRSNAHAARCAVASLAGQDGARRC